MPRILPLLLLLAGCDSVFGLDTASLPPDAPPGLAPGPWMQVTNGDAHSCGLQMDGSLWCWGRGDVGQLGLGDGINEVTVPTRVGSATWLKVSTHASTTCGVQTDHTLWCWGANLAGSVGDGTMVNRTTPIQLAGSWRDVAAGRSHTCAIRDSGQGACWGLGISGQLGSGFTSRTMPTDMTSTQPWAAIDTGGSHTCGIADDHRVWCWGNGAYGQLGNGLRNFSGTPQVVGSFAFDSLALGQDHACAVRSDHMLLCWGFNTAGQLGDPSVQYSTNPAPVADATPEWTSVGAGSLHTCATKLDGSLWCWGNNTGGQVGASSAVSYNPVPRIVTGGAKNWVSVTGGDRSTCAIADDHNLWCFGVDSTGTSGARVPMQVAGMWKRVAAGAVSTCGIASDDSLACWGTNQSGLVGDGTRIARPAPVTIAPPPWRDVSVGGYHACAKDGDDHLWCWGNNPYGLGDGSESRLVPTQITAKQWSTFSVGDMTLAVEAGSGLLYCWGANYFSQCGTGDIAFSAMPRQVGSLMWTAVAAGRTHACGTTSTGLACWGWNGYGEVGDGSQTMRSQPVPITIPAGISTGIADVGSSSSSCARVGTSLWCWGSNFQGQGGSPGNVVEPTPRPVAGSWAQVSVGGTHVCAIATDGSLWCWGGNDRGQLGDGTTAYSHQVPTQVGTDTDWTQISGGESYTCGIRADSSLWCWGNNDYAQLGLGVTPPNGMPRLILP